MLSDVRWRFVKINPKIVEIKLFFLDAMSVHHFVGLKSEVHRRAVPTEQMRVKDSSITSEPQQIIRGWCTQTSLSRR